MPRRPQLQPPPRAPPRPAPPAALQLLLMHAWADSPLVGWEPVKFRKTRATDQLKWKLRRSPGQCTRCQTKRRNKFCTKQSCKQCCVAAGGCATHAVGNASGGRAAAEPSALSAAARALRRCRKCGCAHVGVPHVLGARVWVATRPRRCAMRGLLRMGAKCQLSSARQRLLRV